MGKELLEAMEDLKGVVAELKSAHEKAAAEGKAQSGEVKQKLETVVADFEKKLAAVEAKQQVMEKIAARKEHGEAGDIEAEAKSFSIFATSAQKKTVSVDPTTFAQYKEAYGKYVQFGERGMTQEEIKTLQIGKDPQGGYLVTPERDAGMVTKAFEDNGIMQLVDMKVNATGEREIIVDWADYDLAYYGKELESARDDAGGEDFKVVTIRGDQMFYDKRFSRMALEDAMFDLEGDVLAKMREGMNRTVAAAIVNGNGVGKPRGLLTYAAGTTYGTIEQVAGDTSAKFTWTDALELCSALKGKYHARAVFAMQRSAFFQLLKQVGTDGQFIINVFEKNGFPISLAGYPVKFDSNMPTVAANALSVAFGDFGEAYKAVRRAGATIIRDDITSASTIKNTLRERNGGLVANFEAIKLLKVHA